MPSIKIFVLIIFSLIWTGCASVQDIPDALSKLTKYEIGDTEYELEMDRSDISSMEKRLADNIYPMDTQLTRLLRTLSVKDTYPSLSWKTEVMSKFFWLNEIVVLDKDHKVISRYPETGIKELTFEPVFPEALSLKQDKIMLAIEHTPLGSEILVVSSVFQDFELTGIIIAGFDPRTFIAQSKTPEEVILVSDQEIVWTGQFEHLRPELEKINWDNLVSRKINGQIQLEKEKFFWFARAVGQDWLIYLIKTE
ncbi:MAG: hypothetical protein ACLFPK_03560 [Desulfonatronovibrio sp.]